MTGSMRWVIAAMTVGLLLVTSGCGVAMSDEELFERAREVNFAYKAPVADVQVQVFDGEWRVESYGDAPWACPSDDSKFEFDMTRRTPEGWRLTGTPLELAEEVAAWLDENGWSDIKTRGYSGEIADVVVEAEYPEKHVRLLVVDISPGEVFDAVTVSAKSTCEPGDAHTISTMRRPGEGEREKLPALEEPTAPMSFGHNEDGTRRFAEGGK